VRRLAVLSLHTSPLTQPGAGDSGGMNVYVRELVASLAQAGVPSDVYTRRWADGLPEVVEVEPGFRVVHVPAGPVTLPKEALGGVVDEFAAVQISRPEDLRDRFVPHFYFGCEADDRANAWGFATQLNPGGSRLNAVLGSDIGHWDVLDMRTVLVESRELVECGAITDTDFRDLVCDNAIRLHAGMNADFFAGTAVESYARTLMENS